MIANDGPERDDISNQDCPPADKGMIPNSTPLVHSDCAAEPDLFTDCDMPANMRIISNHAAIPEHTIMSGMRVCHEQAISPDFGDPAMFG